MTRRLLFPVLTAALISTPAAAQDPYPVHCPRGTVSGPLSIPDANRATQDACAKAVDLFKYLAPQLGTTLAGGNAILGSGSTLGGIGHVALGLRVNVLSGTLPRVDQVAVATGGAVATDFPTKKQVLALPTADLAIGLFGGIPLGLTNVGGFDLLVSAAYLPEFDGSNVSVKVPGGSIKLGFGGRLGLVQESLTFPGVAVSVLRRGLPTVDVSARAQNGDSVAVTGLDVSATSWRLTASKSLFMFGLTLGGGQDRYSFEADVTADVQPPTGARVVRTVQNIQEAAFNGSDLENLTRTSYFADLSMNFPFLRLVAEVGQVSGGDIETFNTFGSDAADKSRVYGSIGVRFGW